MAVLERSILLVLFHLVSVSFKSTFLSKYLLAYFFLLDCMFSLLLLSFVSYFIPVYSNMFSFP